MWGFAWPRYRRRLEHLRLLRRLRLLRQRLQRKNARFRLRLLRLLRRLRRLRQNIRFRPRRHHPREGRWPQARESCCRRWFAG